MRAGNLDAAKALIEHGADVNDKDLFKQTPLHYAALRGNYLNIWIELNFSAAATFERVIDEYFNS